jgi:hypothetical protein
MRERGQIAIGEMIFALSVFLVAVTTIFIFLRAQNANMDNADAFVDLERQADNIASILVESPGYPVSWEEEPSSVLVFGLASSDRVLSPAKVAAFKDTDASFIRELFNIRADNYYLRLSYLDGSAIAESGEDASSEQSVTVRRMVNYGNESATLLLRLY